jgi:hypothetical protein
MGMPDYQTRPGDAQHVRPLELGLADSTRHTHFTIAGCFAHAEVQDFILNLNQWMVEVGAECD